MGCLASFLQNIGFLKKKQFVDLIDPTQEKTEKNKNKNFGKLTKIYVSM